MRDADLIRNMLEEAMVQNFTALQQQLGGIPSGGINPFPASALPANNVPLAALAREHYDQDEKVISTTLASALAQTTTTLFTVAGGPIEILALMSICVTANNGNASTLQYQYDGTLGAATTISAASASLASLVAGDLVLMDPAALSTAPRIMTTGNSAILGPTHTNSIIVNGPGVLQAVVGTAAITGTWNHFLRYRPLSRGITITPAF